MKPSLFPPPRQGPALPLDLGWGPLSTVPPHEGWVEAPPGEGSGRPAEPSSLPQLGLELTHTHIQGHGKPLPLSTPGFVPGPLCMVSGPTEGNTGQGAA